MTKPREKTYDELTAELEDGKKKIRQFENREKVLRQGEPKVMMWTGGMSPPFSFVTSPKLRLHEPSDIMALSQ